MTCRVWLVANNYEDVAQVLDRILAIIEAKGKSTRRNWWDDLAGRPGGQPSVREGIEIPILRAAQRRKGVPVTPNALCRNDDEVPPGLRLGRWRKNKKQLPAKAQKAVSKVKAHKVKKAS